MWRKHIEPNLGGICIQRLTPMQIEAVYGRLGVAPTGGAADHDTATQKRRGALGAKSIRNVHALLAKMLGDAEDAGLVSGNPARRAKPPKSVGRPEDEIRAWDDGELRAFLASVRDKRWYPEIRLAAMTGMRRADVLGLRWKDIDFENSSLTVRQTLVAVGYEVRFDTPKTHRPRRIDLDPETMRMLRARRAAQNEHRLAFGEDYLLSDLVFTGEDGSLVHPDTFSQAFTRLVGQTSLERICLQGLRHTHATLLLKVGVPTHVVSERLGHADPGFTLRQYAHALPSMQRDAATKFGELMDGDS